MRAGAGGTGQAGEDLRATSCASTLEPALPRARQASCHRLGLHATSRRDRAPDTEGS